jgi:hypothetical protein
LECGENADCYPTTSRAILTLIARREEQKNSTIGNKECGFGLSKSEKYQLESKKWKPEEG